MPTPYEDFGVRAMSQDELDDLALTQNSVIGTLTPEMGKSRLPMDEVEVGDWKFQWINTRGRHDRGMLILKPTNARTKTIAVQARTQYIKRAWGVSHQEASLLVRAMKGVRYVSEESVLSLVVRSRHDTWWQTYRQNPKDVVISEMPTRYPELSTLSKVKIDAASVVVDRFQKML